MQEEPLHLIPHNLRPKLQQDYGIYVEGDLCPRCRYMVRAQYKGQISAVPVVRIVFSEQEACRASDTTSPPPTPPTPPCWSAVWTPRSSRATGSRWRARPFRLDGELNVANRGLMEFVEIFKADRPPADDTARPRPGAAYQDGQIRLGVRRRGCSRRTPTRATSGHSWQTRPQRRLRDRIMRIYVPYNLRVRDEVKNLPQAPGEQRTRQGSHPSADASRQ